MIPENIGREHILLALEEIDAYPMDRRNRRLGGFFCLVQDRRHYQPWHVIALANRFVNGFEPSQYPSPPQLEMKAFIEGRGFDVVFCGRSAGVRNLLALNCLWIGAALIVSGVFDLSKAHTLDIILTILGTCLVLLSMEAFWRRTWH